MKRFLKVILILAAVFGVAGLGLTAGGAAMGATMGDVSVLDHGITQVLRVLDHEDSWEVEDSEEDMDELERVQGSFRNAIARGEAMAIAETDEHYHDVIYQGTGNDKLVQMLNNLREQMYRYRLEYIKDEDKRQVLLVEHEHILNALKNRNIAEAKKAAREHIDNQEITVSRNIKEQEQEPAVPARGRK